MPQSQPRDDSSLPIQQRKGEMPMMIYGTAWKGDRTASLVKLALEAGFRGVDVAAQPRHYREDLVGEGLRATWSEGKLSRGEIYLQTKFTWTSGQDLDDIPFDPEASISEQVTASVNSSLYAFRSEATEASIKNSYIDCVLLHFPLPTLEQTVEAWTTLETFVPHKIRSLGISNTSLPVMQVLFMASVIRVKPAVVQNRFQQSTNYDDDLRGFCRANHVIYQAFGVLKLNPVLLDSDLVAEISTKFKLSRHAMLYRLVLGLEGIAVLNGTTRIEPMIEDQRATLELNSQSGDRGTDAYWEYAMTRFKSLLRE